jgi:hypothetical protein
MVHMGLQSGKTCSVRCFDIPVILHNYQPEEGPCRATRACRPFPAQHGHDLNRVP